MTQALSALPAKLARYVYGWRCFVRTYRMARGKKRGAGKAKFIHAVRAGLCYRWIVDGQQRGSKGPMFFRKGQRIVRARLAGQKE